MTEPYGYDDDTAQDDTDDRQVTLSRSQIRAMERDAKEARKLRTQLEELQQDLAVTRSGLGDLTERQLKAVRAAADEQSPDALRAAAEELGFVKPAAPAASDTEQQQLEQMAQASAGAAEPGSEDSIARLHRAAAEGQEALLAELARNGAAITPGA